MRSKVHLAAKAQKVAREMEHDYEEVLHLLEGEFAQLKIENAQHKKQLDRRVVGLCYLFIMTVVKVCNSTPTNEVRGEGILESSDWQFYGQLVKC